MAKRLKTVVVMPAYNAQKTLEHTYLDIPKVFRKHILLVDDKSSDNTLKIAKKLGLQIIRHPRNRGYGANQKTCYTMALNQRADIIVMLHPDYQYDSTLIGELVRPIQDGRFDCMLGSRIRARSEALDGGMPFYKYIGNRALTLIENVVLGLNLSEYHTGFRAFHRKVLESIPFHRFSDDFVFDQEILISAVYSQFKIGEIPVPVRYTPESSSINFKRSVQYGLQTVLVLMRYMLVSKGILKSSIFSKGNIA